MLFRFASVVMTVFALAVLVIVTAKEAVKEVLDDSSDVSEKVSDETMIFLLFLLLTFVFPVVLSEFDAGEATGETATLIREASVRVTGKAIGLLNIDGETHWCVSPWVCC